MTNLAIIIPAYKTSFFEKALHSLASQTNKNFNVYIGDDCSPENLYPIIEKFNSLLNIYYKKFDFNIGSKNLVNQWSRCIDLSRHEKWLWLFSDDDIADENCVENFLKLADKNGDRFDVYRFNVTVIDGDSRIVKNTPEGPLEETSEEMAYHLLRDERGNSMPDHIFSREVYKKNGFVYTEYAQGADWATSILFSAAKGIAIIPGARVYWRLSGANISGSGSKHRNMMLPGHLQFIKWLLKHFAYLKCSASGITYDMIRQAARVNLRNVILYHYKGFTIAGFFSVTQVMRKNLQLTYQEMTSDIYFIHSRTNKMVIGAIKVKILLKKILPALV